MVDGDLHHAVVAAIELAGNVSQWPVANSQPFGMAGETPIADVAAEPGDFVVSVIASCGPAAMLVGPFTALPSVGGVVTAYRDVATAGTVGPRWDVGGTAWTALTDAYH